MNTEVGRKLFLLVVLLGVLACLVLFQFGPQLGLEKQSVQLKVTVQPTATVHPTPTVKPTPTPTQQSAKCPCVVEDSDVPTRGWKCEEVGVNNGRIATFNEMKNNICWFSNPEKAWLNMIHCGGEPPKKLCP